MKRTLAFISLTSSAFAHHGQDFFLALDARTPSADSLVAFGSASWSDASDGAEFSLEPGMLYGLGHGFAIGSSLTLSETSSDSFGFAGITPVLSASIPTPFSSLRLGASASYHFSDGSYGETEVHFHHIPAPDPGSIGGNPDAPDGGDDSSHVHRHSHGGIHRHGESHFQFRAIAEWQLTPSTRLVANALAVGDSSDDIDLGYALALRQDLNPRFALGLEAIGDFNRHGYHEVLAGIFWTPSHDWTFRLGAGRSLGSDSKNIALQSGFTCRF